MILTIEIPDVTADEKLKIHAAHNLRSLDFTRMEPYMDRRRYAVNDIIDTIVTREILKQSRMLTLPHNK